MSRFTISINDGTTSIYATISTPDAEMFMPLNALELKEAEDNGVDISETISTSMQEQTIVAFLRSYEITFRGQSEMRIKVVKAYGSVPPTQTFTTPSASPSPAGNTEVVTPISSAIKGQSSASLPATKKHNS